MTLTRNHNTLAKLKSCKPVKNLPKRTLALIWLYLQIIGKPVERLLSEENLWTFDRNDFEKACLFLMIENAVYQGESELQMRELISKHFTCENELAIWSKDICQTVNKLIYIIRFTS